MGVRDLFERMKRMNSYRQDIGFADARELIRFKWLTVKNLVKHYEKFEEFLVEKGFARLATAEERATDGEQVKWFEDQRRNGGNFDEMGFGLGKDANGLGGRQPTQFVFQEIRNSGEPDQQSNIRVTLFLGVNYADEPLPGLIILPSAAEKYKVKEELLKRFHQVEGKYGHNSRKKFDFMIAASPKGSMTKEILNSYLSKFSNLYPGLRDEIRNRFLFKTDSGPGRSNCDVNFTAKVNGIYIYPGVPNTSEVTQEMDQLFAYFKSLMERNRRRIVQEKGSRNLGQATLLDLPNMIFGGTYVLEDGHSIELANAFEKGFSADHLRAAREKCGYCPANRASLLHNKCRRQFGDENIETINGCPADNKALEEHIRTIESGFLSSANTNDSDYNAYDQLVLDLEKTNHDAVDILVEMGFDKAILAQRFIQINEIQDQGSQENVRTYPGSRARQDLLQHCSTAGQHFHITGGSDAMNSDDMLAAMERKKMKKRSENLRKIKNEIEKSNEISTSARAIISQGGPKKLPELRTCIQWKSGSKEQAKGNKPLLIKRWNELKNKTDPKQRTWQPVHQARMEQLNDGDLNFVEDASLFKRAYARKCTVIHEQIQFIDSNSRCQLFASAYSQADFQERLKLREMLDNIDSTDKVFVPTCLDYDTDEDDLQHSFVLNDDSIIAHYCGQSDSDSSSSSSSSSSGSLSIHIARRKSKQQSDDLSSPSSGSLSRPPSLSLDSNDLPSNGDDSNSHGDSGSEHFEKDTSVTDEPSNDCYTHEKNCDDACEDYEDKMSEPSISSYENLTLGELIAECRNRDIRATRRFKKESLIAKLKTFDDSK